MITDDRVENKEDTDVDVYVARGEVESWEMYKS